MKIDVKDLLIIALVAFVGFSQYTAQNNTNQQHGTEGHRINSGTSQVKTEATGYISKKDLREAVSRALEGHSIKAKAEIVSDIEGSWGSRKNEQSVNTKKYETKRKQIYWVDEATGKKMPVGVAIYSPKKESKGKDPWVSKAYNLEFRTEVVRSIDRNNGIHNTVSIFATPKNIKDFDGEFPVNVNLDESVFKEVIDKKYEWSLWNPTLSMGLTTATSLTGFNIDTGFMGKFNFINYGYSSSLPMWQFASPTFSVYGKKTTFGIEAVSYNLGEILPVVKDLHVGVGYNIDKTVSINLTTVF